MTIYGSFSRVPPIPPRPPSSPADVMTSEEEQAWAERDPHGKDPHEPGAKLDAGKPRAGLVLGDFARALTEVARVGTYGAEKYTASGWCEVPGGIDRYTDAMLRHWLAERRGEATDPDSGLLHAAQVAWNALARLELMLRENEELPS